MYTSPPSPSLSLSALMVLDLDKRAPPAAALSVDDFRGGGGLPESTIRKRGRDEIKQASNPPTYSQVSVPDF